MISPESTLFGAANAWTGERDPDTAIARFIRDYPDDAQPYVDACHLASEPQHDGDDADAWELIRSAAEELRAAEPSLSFDEAVSRTLAQEGGMLLYNEYCQQTQRNASQQVRQRIAAERTR